MDKLAIIGTGYMARIIGERAKKLGIETHCFSIDVNSVAAKVCDYFHNVNILDFDKLLDVCKKIGINGVVSTTELTILPTAYVAEHLGLRGNKVDVARNITNKYWVREKVRNIDGLSQPMFKKVMKGDYISNELKFPIIIKPIAAGGKRGINVVYEIKNVKDALEEAINISKVQGALIEEFLDGGQEYSVESLSYNGKHYVIQITEKDSSGAPHCVELGHHQPANLSKEMRSKVEKVICGVLKATGIENGPCHTEIKIINGKIYLIEINGRPGGDHIAYPLTELSTGYHYITGIIMAALDKLNETELQHFETHYCGVYFVTTQNAELKPIFDTCEKEKWFYKKNKVSEELMPITHNDGFNTNYFMYYCDDRRPSIKGENIKKIDNC